VTSEAPNDPAARLFVALDLPPAVRAGIAAWQASALGDPALRPVGERALHVTLAFLGRRPAEDIGRVGRILLGLTRRRVSMRLDPDPVGIPRGRPRLVALDAPSEAAEATFAELSAKLVEERLYEPEKRPFWPHVTVARVRPERGRKGVPRRLEAMPGPLRSGLVEPFDAVRVTLYRSTLRPEGAEYTPLAGLELPSPQATA
jgi:2'-5' RNA ligase